MKALIIEKQKLEENIKKIKQQTYNQEVNDSEERIKIIAVVKCNGYGLGIVEYTKLLIENGIDFFAVSSVEEALQLRQAGIENDILMLTSTALEDEVRTLIENDIILTIGSKEDIEVTEKIAEEKQIKVRAHLKIDTGMSRYGFLYNEREQLIEQLKTLKNIQIQGTYSHFSNSYYDEKYTKIQFSRFIDVVEVLKMNQIETGMLHICNSSAFIKYPNMYLNAVRIGSAFLGRLSCPNVLKLNKIGYLETKVSEIKEIEKGSYVSYSNAYKTKKKTKIAIVPCGYSEGFNVTTGKDMFRKIDKIRYVTSSIKDLLKRQKLDVAIKDENFTVIGRVGTHHVVCDITGKNINIGDTVIMNINPKYLDSGVERKFI